MNRFALLWVLSLAVTSWGPVSHAADPLFAAHDSAPIAIELALPLQDLLKKRKSKPTFPGQLLVDGQAIPVEVSSRGKSRLERCRFPPLWLDLQKKAAKGTEFEKQNKLKLVTHCGRNMPAKGYLAAEMLAYRMFNLLTDVSFRVRAVSITYRDSERDNTQVQPGFLIEHKRRLAKRLDLTLVEQPSLKLSVLDPAFVSLANLYQYMIGNTDFSFSQGPPEDGCCHNSVPVQSAAGAYYSIPYDFDSSGLVNPPYAVPAESLGLKRLTQRRYRGFCRHNDTLPEARQTLLQAKGQLYALVDTFNDIPNLNRGKVTKFLNGFYDVLESDRNFQRRIVSACRKR